MKTYFICLCISGMLLSACNNTSGEGHTPAEQNTPAATSKKMYIDVHDLEPGKVSFNDVMQAHQKDLAVQGKYGVKFKKFWVDEEKGKVYCLSDANDSADVIKTHREAHGLLPSVVMEVKEGE